MSQLRKPRVWLEITHVLTSPTRVPTGVGYFTDELVRALLKLDQTYDYSLVGNLFFSRPRNPILSQTRTPSRLFRLFPGKVWNQLYKRGLLPPITWLLRGRPEAMVFFNFVRYPVSRGVKTLTVIHDLTYKVHPEYVAASNFGWLNHAEPSAKASTRVITISEATKHDICRYYGVSPEKVSVVYPGVDLKRFASAQLAPEARQRYHLPSRYFLYLGTLEPRKNITGIIAAYRAMPAKLQRECGLVLAGGKGWNDADIWQAVADYDAPGAIITPGYVASEDAPGLYKEAVALVFPSHYEGFGMPVIEAMAAGTAVITATNSALPESGGKAAIYVDADSVGELSAAMASVATNQALRTKLIKAGKEHVRSFTWEHSAQQLKAAIDAALNGS